MMREMVSEDVAAAVTRDIEGEAHSFAANLLMPKRRVLGMVPTHASVSQILAAKHYFKVSAMAMARRAYELGRLSEWEYRQVCSELTVGAADVFLETERKDFRMFSLEERERAVELYFTTPMTTAQVVEHLGYPTRQCLERWLAMDSRYAGHMAKPIIPLETRRRAVELVLGGMQQKQAAKQLGAGVGAVHGWVRAYRKGGMAALQPKNRNSAQGNKPAGSRRWPSAADDDDAEALRRRVEELELENALMREVVEARRKRPRRRPAAPVEQGEDPVDRPVEAGVFARLDDMLARHRAQQLPLPPRPARR